MAWFDSNWGYRIKITVDKDKVDSNLSDFPVYINLDDLPDSFFSNVKAAGEDIRITQSNGTTEQAREVVFIDTGAKTGELHFKASSLSSSGNTDFYIYYGNAAASEPAAASAYGSQNAWDSNYKAVFHLQEDPTGGAGAMLDSTATGAHGTPAGGLWIAGDSVNGKLSGKCLDFTVSGNNVAISTDLAISQDLTVDLWFYHDGQTGTYDHLIDNISDWALSINSNNIHTFLDLSGGAGEGWKDSGDSVSTGAWHHAALVYDHNTARYAYLDGVLIYSLSAAGNIRAGGTQSINSSGSWFDGKEDEVRIHNTNRSAAWLKATFDNADDTSTFYSVGSQEVETPEVTFIPQIMII